MTYSNRRIGSYYGDADYAIMPFWDDMNPSSRGEVYYYSDSSKTVVTWWNVPHYPSTGSFTFQLVMYASGAFRFNYMNINPTPPHLRSSPTVGVVRLNNIADGTLFYWASSSSEIGTKIVSRMSVSTKIAKTTMEVTDYSFDRDTIAAGGGGIAKITVENTGSNDALLGGSSIGGLDIAQIYMLGPDMPNSLSPGESFTLVVGAVVMAGTPDGSIATLDLTIEYNSVSGNPLTHSVEINIKWKESGGDRSEYVQSQDAFRHILRLYFNIGAGYVTDNGEFASALSAFINGDYKKAKNWAVKPGGPGLGFWGLAPGQVEGNEGNGNGGLKGNP
jgi:hypothetical protein